MSVDITMLNEKIKEESSFVTLLRNEMAKVIVGHADIVDAIRAHQVIVIAGETGSGKTTQIPKMSRLPASMFSR